MELHTAGDVGGTRCGHAAKEVSLILAAHQAYWVLSSYTTPETSCLPRRHRNLLDDITTEVGQSHTSGPPGLLGFCQAIRRLRQAEYWSVRDRLHHLHILRESAFLLYVHYRLLRAHTPTP